MAKSIVISKNGGAEVLEVKNIKVSSKLKEGQVLVRHTAIAVNHTDVHYRNGQLKLPKMPFIPGIEACGVVEQVAEGSSFEVGQRVAYATSRVGAYSEKRVIGADKLINVPDYISDDVAAAGLLKGLTAHYLLFNTFSISKGLPILIHDVTGDTGHILCQWAKKLGALVIGTVNNRDKVQAAKSFGCDHIIVRGQEDISQRVIQITNNIGVPIVYDSVGRQVYKDSIKSLMKMGLYVSYGQSSGFIPPINIMELSAKGVFITRPSLQAYRDTKMLLVMSANEVFQTIKDNVITPKINKYSFNDIASAQRDLEEGKVNGSVIVTF